MPEVVYFDTRTAAEIAQGALRDAARAALDASDVTILRCGERNMAVPQAWADYREALRAIVRDGAGVLPARPDWP